MIMHKLKRLLWLFKNIFHRYTKEEKITIKNNKKLIKEFPFLLPRNRLTDLILYNYDYLYTELDNLPDGWRKSFGIEICQNIKELLIYGNHLNKYRIVQIKEKYGTLRWYSRGIPLIISEEYLELIDYYEDKSMLVCINCGNPTAYQTHGWIEYICEDCLKKYKERNSQLEYSELTWKDAPVRTIFKNNKKHKKESKLKGDMMVTWKRYSKYNNLKYGVTEIKPEKENLISNMELW